MSQTDEVEALWTSLRETLSKDFYIYRQPQGLLTNGTANLWFCYFKWKLYFLRTRMRCWNHKNIFLDRNTSILVNSKMATFNNVREFQSRTTEGLSHGISKRIVKKRVCKIKYWTFYSNCGFCSWFSCEKSRTEF